MTWTALALVMTAALLHAVWNIGAKKAGGGTHFVVMGAVFAVLVWAPLVCWIGLHELRHWNAWQWRRWWSARCCTWSTTTPCCAATARPT